MFDDKSNNTRDLKNFSIEELEAEIKRQKEVAVPTVIENPVITEKLINGCKEYIEAIQQERSLDNFEHFVFEAAVEAVFGPTVWKWINKNV